LIAGPSPSGGLRSGVLVDQPAQQLGRLGQLRPLGGGGQQPIGRLDHAAQLDPPSLRVLPVDPRLGVG
jgi:hypothetical protein